MVPFIVVIPARHASTRLPGKMLADIAGKPMVVHVCEQAAASGAARVVVATDHPDIASAVHRHGHTALMTRPDHATGTDRIAEAVGALGCAPGDIVVNVQGDEPLIPPGLVSRVATELDRWPEASVSTACTPLTDAADLLNPNAVKVVFDRRGRALLFSRAPIPWPRDAYAQGPAALPAGLPAHRHIGIYGYRAGFLGTYARLAPCALERYESLEQLRALWHGYGIQVIVENDPPPAGVDTPDDLARVRALKGHAG